jgi:zinc-finger binding domain of transposase IS66
MRSGSGPSARCGRKPGGQPGREGRTLRQVSTPNEVVVHEPGACAGCGGTLSAEDAPAGIIRRQVFDIPQITVRVVEHRLLSRPCACGVRTTAALLAELFGTPTAAGTVAGLDVPGSGRVGTVHRRGSSRPHRCRACVCR